MKPAVEIPAPMGNPWHGYLNKEEHSYKHKINIVNSNYTFVIPYNTI